ncbi:hypothetical protein BO99DRAFT_216999 [Aspergillus violaceofuscus CBS 115571]|uniref:Uncharacterized protein n=1 Tax=Aspergillus violaceofuscus (strain CBS 115571) TaxID=1450538 RepID=A0A2V5HXV5_ASPV1|nr:hypothetical protein BO99DRAFT_216999 [Aspergillus violaceofuscus CBS 115571]
MYSITSAAFTATRLLSSFHSVQFAWMVSIEVGIPNINADIRLVMLSWPDLPTEKAESSV